MSDFLLIDGDQVLFIPTFTPAVVMVMPGTLAGSGKTKVRGKPVCLEGDEKDVAVRGCVYLTPTHPVPGTGTLKIAELAGNQLTTQTKDSGKKLLLKGQMFTAKFEVQSPAQQPTPGGPVPDANRQYSGQGQFVTLNSHVKAT